MVLCKLCQDITISGLLEERPSKRVKDSREVGYEHYGSFEELEASAATCECCRLILRTIDKPAGFTFKPNKHHYVRLMGSGRHGVSMLLVVVAGSDLRAYFDVVADPKSPAFLSGAVEGKPPLAAANSTESFSMIKEWLQDCLDNHPECSHPAPRLSGSRQSFPTRILDVSPNGSPNAIILADGCELVGDYATLSYCWGQSQTIQTTRSTLSAHKEAISFDSLPKSLRDAVTITRELRLRYLWIDALCIVQDDKVEWEREAAKMGRIYRDSIVTIAATGASDCNRGCFLPRPRYPADIINLPYRAGIGSPKVEGEFFLLPTRDSFTRSVLQSTWNTRGWILQERLLSRRLIHFAQGRTFWECARHSIGEDCKPVIMETKRSLNGYLTGTAIDWCRLVEDYTKRKLSNCEDKLIALLGLAGERAALTGDLYHFGLWDSYFHTELLWYVVMTSPKLVPGTLAPSWSWASVNGAVKWESWVAEAIPVGTISASDRLLKLTTTTKPIAPSTPIMGDKKLEYKVTSGQVYDSHLMRTVLAIASADSRDPGAEIGWATFDEGTPSPSSGLIFAARISDNKNAANDERDTYNVLILKHMPDEDVYGRIGIGEVVKGDWFTDEQEVTVSII